jgi:hypothetical protein
VTGPVRVTHPFHPLCGQELECVGRRHNWGEDRILYRDSQGYLASVPTGWTSVAPEDPYVVLGGGRSPFRITDLLELAALVTRLRS